MTAEIYVRHPFPWTCAELSKVIDGNLKPVFVVIYDQENKPVMRMPVSQAELAKFIVGNLNRHQPKYTQEIVKNDR